MKLLLKLTSTIATVVLLFNSNVLIAQSCTANILQHHLTIQCDVAQTQAGINKGDYQLFYVENTAKYQFSTEGSTGNTAITGRQNDGNGFAMFTQNANNISVDDEDITWTSNFSGNLAVIVTESSCSWDANSAVLEYSQVKNFSNTTSADDLCSGYTRTLTVSGAGHGGWWSMVSGPGALVGNLYTANGGSGTVTARYNLGACFEDVSFTVPNAVSAIISTVNDALCNGDNSGSITATAVDGKAPYSYAWSNGATTATNSGLSAGSYTVTISDYCGSTATASAEVSEPSQLNASVSSSPASCPTSTDGSISATAFGATPPYSYLWNNGDTTSTISNVGVGTYTIIITDANACTTSTTGSIGVNDTIAPSFTFCPSAITTNTDPGQCNAVVNFPEPSGSDNCPSSGYVISLSSTIGNGGTFPLGNTDVVYTITDDAGNSSQCSFTVTVEDNEAPAISCSADISVNTDPGQCGAVVSFGLPNGTDNCSGTSTVQIGGLSSGSVFPVGSSIVTFEVTDDAENTAQCSFNVSVIDSEAPSISCPADVTIVTNSLCQATYSGSSATFTDNCPGATIASSPALPVTFSGQGTYTIEYTVTDAVGNTATCTQTITVLPSVVAEAGPDKIAAINSGGGPDPLPCVSLTASATGGNGAYVYSWEPTDGISDPNDATTEACPSETTVYYVTITDAAGCSNVDSVTVTVIDIDNPAHFTFWRNNKNKVYVCYPSTCTTYVVNIRANCNSKWSLCWHLQRGAILGQCTGCKTSTLVEEKTELSALKAYPNPFDGMTTISYTNKEDGQVSVDVFDMKGALVSNLFSGLVKAGEQNLIEFDAGNLSESMYIVRYTTATEIKHLKLMLFNRD